jgi:aarF domain-containing kinase
MQVAARWNKNLARLYARRMLQLAAASAASYRLKSDLESKMIDKPSAWIDWQAKDWEDTAMATLGNTKLSRFWMASKRLASLALLSSPLLVLLPLSSVSDKAKNAAWKYALWGIERAGPTWIKLVQWATTRQDLFSPEFCQYFGKLRDDTDGHTWKETQMILENEYGKDWENILDLDPTPIGSGCIAQVYRGYLKKPIGQSQENTKVAIKVQHPNIFYKVCIDFYLLRKLTQSLEAIPKLNLEYLSLSDTIRQFRDIMLPQLDLTLEASHLKRFNHDFANDDQVEFPVPIDELTTTQILAETFCEGVPIMEYTKPGTPKEEREQLALLGLKTTLKMIFLNDFVHGDLHPGNILISGKYPNLVMNLLDCGLVLEMGPEQHVNLVKVLGAFTRKDGRLAGQLLVDLKSESQAGPKDMELFIKGIEQICVMDDDQVSLIHILCYLCNFYYFSLFISNTFYFDTEFH